MTTKADSKTLQTIWKDQSIWSQVASQLKTGIFLARTAALLLGILGAILATLATQSARDKDSARTLNFCGALSLVGATVVARGFGQNRLANWIRARSVSEALKQEAYFFLTGTRPYMADDREAILNSRAKEIVTKAADLMVLAATKTPKERQTPLITGADDYISKRVMPQIEKYYLPKARELGTRLKICQWTAGGLTGVAALASGMAGVTQKGWMGAWVAVATTVAGAIVAHAGAVRYEHNVISYYSTARQLQSLCDQFQDAVNKGAPPATLLDEFVRRCEEVISIENQAWMADWQKMKNSPPPSNTQATTPI